MKFSERYGYLKPSEVIIREKITPDIQNAICNCLYSFNTNIGDVEYKSIDKYIWCYFLNQQTELYSDGGGVIKRYIQEAKHDWFNKLDLIEIILSLNYESDYQFDALEIFIEDLNSGFERLNFGYRIIENQVVEITSEHDIKTIENAIDSNRDNVKLHLNNALKLYSQRPEADYRNSIKESITAVEALSRKITGDKGINLSKMESAGIKIPPILRKSFEILYGYTNDPKTGIRHALMDNTGEYVPGSEEALFMLVSCSAFINYLNSKMK